MIWAVVLTVFACLALIKLLTGIFTRPKNLPPGPVGFPLVGCLPFLSSNTAHLTLTDWCQKYGPITSFYLANTPIVVLGNYEAVKEALIKNGETFAARPFNDVFRVLNENYGILTIDGDRWRDQRRFALHTLRDMGLGRSILETKIQEEVQFILEEIEQFKKRPFNIKPLLNNAVSNVICSLVFGRRFEYSDARFQKLQENMNLNTSQSNINIVSYLNYFPFLKYLRYVSWKAFMARRKFLHIFTWELINEHKSEYQPESEPNDFIFAFLKARDEGANYCEDTQLLYSVINLFVAGSETTSTTLAWAILYLCLYPEVQDRMRKEISDTLGSGNLPQSSDRVKLPFVEACIAEVQRIMPLVPLSLPHRATKDTIIQGYHIPKDATVIPCLWSILRDPNLFPDPTKFDPMRFMEDGKFKKIEASIPFSAGKRICLGESLAKMELFLFLTGMIQRFRFEFSGAAGIPNPDDYFAAITLSPKSFDIVAYPL